MGLRDLLALAGLVLILGSLQLDWQSIISGILPF